MQKCENLGDFENNCAKRLFACKKSTSIQPRMSPHTFGVRLGLTSPDLGSFLSLPLRQLELALELLSTGVDAGGDGGGRYLRIYFAPSFNEASLRKPWAGIHVSAHKSRSAHGCD